MKYEQLTSKARDMVRRRYDDRIAYELSAMYIDEQKTYLERFAKRVGLRVVKYEFYPVFRPTVVLYPENEYYNIQSFRADDVEPMHIRDIDCEDVGDLECGDYIIELWDERMAKVRRLYGQYKVYERLVGIMWDLELHGCCQGDLPKSYWEISDRFDDLGDELERAYHDALDDIEGAIGRLIDDSSDYYWEQEEFDEWCYGLDFTRDGTKWDYANPFAA